MYKYTCILYTSQCFLNCWASKGPFGQGKARDWPRLLGPRLLRPRLLGPRLLGSRLLGPRLLGPRLLGTLMYKVSLSFHHMAVINFTVLISSGVRAQQGEAWRRRCCVVFNQEFQPVLSLVLHLFPPAKKCCKPWEMVERRGRIPLMAPPYFPSICHTFHSWGKISLPCCSRRSVNPKWPGSETYSCTLLLSVGNQRLWLFTITFWKRKVFSYTWSIITVVKLKTSVVINVENSC